MNIVVGWTLIRTFLEMGIEISICSHQSPLVFVRHSCPVTHSPFSCHLPSNPTAQDVDLHSANFIRLPKAGDGCALFRICISICTASHPIQTSSQGKRRIRNTTTTITGPVFSPSFLLQRSWCCVLLLLMRPACLLNLKKSSPPPSTIYLPRL